MGFYRIEGGGGGAVHASVEQASDSGKGIEVALLGKDATWKLAGEQREIGQRGHVDFRGGNAPGNYVRLTAPLHFTLDDDQRQELANAWDVRVYRGTDRVPEVAEVAAVAAVIERSAAVHLFFGAGLNELMNIQRAAAGADGNDWDIRFSVFDGAVGTTGVQLAIVGTEFQVLISSTDVPSARTVRNEINNEADFRADFVAGSEPDAAVLMTTVLATALPNGDTVGTDRFEDFTGGVDAVEAVVGVPAVPSVPPEDPSFSGNLPETNDVNRWELTVNNEITLDQLAEFLLTAMVGVHTDFVDGVDHGVVPFGAVNVGVFGDGSVMLRSADHAVNGQLGSLAPVVGNFAGHALEDAINADPPEVTEDIDSKTITVSYSVTDDAADILALFKGVTSAALIQGTEDGAVLEAPSFCRPFRGSGGGDGIGSPAQTTKRSFRSSSSNTLADITALAIVNNVWSDLFEADGITKVVCPEAGEIEFLAHAVSGGRDNGIAFAKNLSRPIERDAHHRRDANCTVRQPLVWDKNRWTRHSKYTSQGPRRPGQR